jgi:oxygen-independent coproporphyrinogen-3 oxidase
MVDQDRQEAEVAIGLGGSSSCRASEAITDVNWKNYAQAVERGRVPLGSATGFDAAAQEARAVKMALSTLQPVRDDLHHAAYGRSLHDSPWREKFASLAERGLVTVSADGVALTGDGEVLVEAIINTEL